MPAQDSQGRYVPQDESLAAAQLASAARTTSSNGTAFDTADIESINGSFVVSAASGTNPTFDMILQTTADGTNYYTVGAFTQKTATATAEAKVFGPLGSLSRWKWTIGGTDTPSFTCAITATVDRDD